MSRRLRLCATVFVTVGVTYTFMGRGPDATAPLLLIGLLLALGPLLMDRRGRRRPGIPP